ncbi:hypothetical protein ACQ0QQ_20160 [Lysinibacillus sphaericus]
MKKVYQTPTLVQFGKAEDLTKLKCIGGYPEGYDSYEYYKPDTCRW